MKRLLWLLAIATVTSCGVSSHAIEEMDEISYIMYNYYPQLHEYFMEGVLEVHYLKEGYTDEGEKMYNIRYSFCRYEYPNKHDRLDTIRELFPDVYYMYINGLVKITSFYKYVDRNTGEIRHHISFRRNYGFFINRTVFPPNGTRITYKPLVPFDFDKGEMDR